MDGQNETNKGGAAVATPEGASGAASSTAQPGAVTPAASPSGASAGASEGAARTYRDEDVQKIVRERLADEQRKWEPYKQYGTPEQLKTQKERLERYENAFKGDAPVGPTAEEKELRELLSKNGFVQKDEVEGIKAQLQAIDKARYDAHANMGRGLIAKLAQDKFGTSDAADLESFETLVSASIAKDKESLAAWNSGDTGVISKHFEKVFNAPMFKNASARYSSGKAKDKAEVPPSMPKGGVQAPSSQERKMSGEERRDAAWKRIQELDGQ